MTAIFHKMRETKPAFDRHVERLAAQFSLAEIDPAVIDTADGETGMSDIIAIAVRELTTREALNDGLDQWIDTLKDRYKRHEEACSRLRLLIAEIMLETGLKTIRTPWATITAKTTKPGIDIEFEALPNEYKREKTTFTIDREKIDAALEVGAEIPGVTRTNGRPSLSVRVK